MVRILIYSHSPLCRTGFGVITKYISEGLVRHGFDVEIYGIIQPEETVSFNMGKIKHHGFYNVQNGSSWLLDYCKENVDVVLTNIDTWISPVEFLQKLDKEVCLIQYALVDHTPISPVVIESLRRADAVVAMSKFGYEELKIAGYAPELIPIGVDLENFKAVDKKASKKVFTCEDKFVVLWNAQNHWRKGIEELFKAWSIFSKDRKDVLLHVHTNTAGGLRKKKFEAYDLRQMMKENNIRKESVIVTTENFNSEMMNVMYNSSDVYLNTSYGGAYEMPITEAFACKVPVIAPLSTAMTELIDNGKGFGVETVRTPNYHLAKELFSLENFTESKLRAVEKLIGYQFKPVVESIVDNMEILYDDRRFCTDKAYEFVKKRSWNNVINEWVNIL